MEEKILEKPLVETDFVDEATSLTSNFEIISFVEGDGEDASTIDGQYFYIQEDGEIQDSLKNYIYFNDEEIDSPAFLGDSGSGTVILRAPTKYSWGVILGGLTLGINLLVSGTAIFFSQSNFNTKVLDKIETLEKNQESLLENVYNKREQDLKRENIKLELEKQNDMIIALKERMDRG